MRHRAAVGITEDTDSIAIITSEETGKIAYVKEGELFNNRNIIQLEQFLNNDIDYVVFPESFFSHESYYFNFIDSFTFDENTVGRNKPIMRLITSPAPYAKGTLRTNC